MKRTVVAMIVGLGLVGCAHRNSTNTHADQNHEAPRAVDRVQDATNGGGPLIDNKDVQRTRQGTNTNVNPR